MDWSPRVPIPKNEPVQTYGPGSSERSALKAELHQMSKDVEEIPLIIGGREVRTGRMAAVVMPHDHDHVLARVHLAGPEEVEKAIEAALRAKADWENMPTDLRMGIFLKAAELLAGRWRQRVNAATMLGQSKTCFQAEIDAACELIDFWRWNPWFLSRILGEQPGDAAGM
jgi:1-pyrroline-5-carboxylate dehydrogenase